MMAAVIATVAAHEGSDRDEDEDANDRTIRLEL
jgi:hypothetical protein